MNYIFYYSGKVPDYVEYSLNSILNADREGNIFFCSNDELKYKNVVHIKPEKVESKLTKQVKDLNYYAGGDQNPLWASSMMRIFYINDVANYLNLKSFIHFDSDVMLYKSYRELSHLFKNDKLNITPLTENFLVFGYSYISNNETLSEITNFTYNVLSNSKKYEDEFYDGNRLTEMKALYICYKKNPSLFNLLPVLPESEVIFDPGSYGQYLGGVHYKRFSKKYINEKHLVGKLYLKDNFQIKKKDGVAFALKDGKKYELANIHVHKKNLKKFKPKDHSWKTR